MSLLSNFYNQLGLSEDYIASLALPKFNEETNLVFVEVGPDGREKFLMPDAKEHWLALKQKALADGITFFTYSAYRSFEFQCELIKERMKRGESVEQATKRLTPPGFSEHHTGCAVDVTTPNWPHPAQKFDQSAEFRWLSDNAARFKFYLSYPKDNKFGMMYEPWHWCFRTSV